MNPFRGKLTKPCLALTMIVLLIMVSFLQRGLNRERSELGLTRLSPLENAPPILAFTTVALGGFRGLVANMLWIRLNQLQEDGKYFEMVQLADWITKLQPHFVSAWIWNAWNLSYNISVKFPDHEDRWLWVQRGIELLRDHGLKYNPQETMIYRELAWHFQHKMGYNLDDAHMLYKVRWAERWEPLLNDGRPDWEALINPQGPEQTEIARAVRETYKMDPVIMREVDEKYGPLEWRLPEAHAIYWAHLGLKLSIREDDYIALRRNIFQSMQSAFHRGRLVKFPVPDPEVPDQYHTAFELTPNVAITEKVNATYEEQMELADENLRDNVGTAHKNFLRTAVYFLYVNNQLSAAEKYYRYVRKLYPGSIPEEESLEEYVFKRVEEEFGSTSRDRMTAMLMGYLKTAMFDLAVGEEERAVGRQLIVRKMMNRYYGELGSGQDVRVGLATFEQLREDAIAQLLEPEGGMPAILRERLRTRLGLPEDWQPKSRPVSDKATHQLPTEGESADVSNTSSESIEGPPAPVGTP